MKRVGILSGFLAASMALQSAEFKIGEHTFTLPEGFTVEKVAGPGLVDRPIVADFDESGRLYVAESSGSNDPVDKQLKEKPHRIVRLDDTDSDGVFDKTVVYADKMMFPEGAMWLEGSLYVSAPPVIWKLTDTDNDGVADRREEWLDAKTLTGCANDLHGPYLGLDGWIYWCKGAFAKQTYERTGAAAFETRAAHIFRRRPEGGLVEAVMTGGMDNPVDVTFTPEGERIFTTTFFQNPGGGKRDGLVHAIYGGVYGKVHDVIDDHRKTGDLMPVLTHLGPAAPAGLTRYESAMFGEAYRDNLFACLFNLHKVTRHVLKPAGATYKTDDSDFLVSDNTDFHPTDVIEDADGSLLVIDTGGWYKLCCPTSQLWKPDVLGAIYRIRRMGAPNVPDPRGAKIEWEKLDPGALAKLLADERPAVVRSAIQYIRRTGESAGGLVPVLHGDAPERQKVHAVWALASNQDKKLRLLESALEGSNPASVRHAALHALSVTPEKANAKRIASLLSVAEPPSVRRAAAELLGRTKDKGAVPDLLRAAERLKASSDSALPDRVEEHSIIYALIEINAPVETRFGLISENSFVRRVALIALDQMEKGDLRAKDVVPLLNSSDHALRETANWIIAHRNAWGNELAEHFRARLSGENLTAVDRDQITGQLTTLSGSPSIQKLVAELASKPGTPDSVRTVAFKVMKGATLKETPAEWTSAIVSSLRTAQPGLVTHAASAASTLPFKKVPDELKAELSKVAHTTTIPNDARLEALAAIAGDSEIDPDILHFLRQQLTPQTDSSHRRLAAGILARAKLSDDQLKALLSDLNQASPLEIAQFLAAYEKASSESVGMELIATLKQARGLSNVSVDQLQHLFSKYPESVKASARELIAMVNVDAAQQSARIEEVLPKLQGGDIRRGQAIFNSTRAACSSCHAIGYLGGDLGPDLTRIGQVRTERDLVEAIIYPSASFVRSYEPVIVSTRDGEEFSGILKKDAPDELILSSGPGTQIRLARSEVIESRPGKLSLMPQGLDEQLSAQEMADLLAFLKATRW